MLANLIRDEPSMPVVQRHFAGYPAMLAGTRELLMAGRGARGAAARRRRAAIGHALAFATWRSLAREQELADSEAAELMCRQVAAA
jgi:hypothetical protein